MLKLLLFIVILSAAAVFGYAVQSYDFVMSGQIGSYFVEVSAAFLTGSLIVLLAVLYGVLRFLWWIKTSPSRIAGRIKKDSERKAYKQIMQGFSLLAAGDANGALKLAQKTSKALPQEKIVTMLAAQAAVVGGKPELAREYYTELAAHEESRFIGFRGLIAEQIAGGKIKEATKTAEDLLTSAPKSKWLNGAVIDLAFKLQDWDRLERYLKKSEANKALTKQDLKDKFAVFYFVKATAARKENRFEDALWLVEKSTKYSPDFLPAILLNGSLLLSSGEFKKLKKLVLESWKTTPHPELAVFFERAIADYKPQKQLKLAEELYNKNPSDYESVIFYAKALINHGKSADAAELLKKAAGFKTTKSICRLMAQIDDSKAWNKRLDTAEDDKCWYCAKTGARYSQWQIFSDSGEFNTIVWGFAPKLDSTTTNQFLSVI